MNRNQADSADDSPVFGNYLAKLRRDRGYTLREVETTTGQEISNAYLSQLEHGRIKRPSPNVLYTLAHTYGVDYGGLMERAGYVYPGRNANSPQRNQTASTLSIDNLTADEEKELRRYLEFLRSRKKDGE